MGVREEAVTDPRGECCVCSSYLFGLSHHEPRLFSEAQGGRSILYVIYRWIIALFFTGVLIYSIINSVGGNYGIWIIYLTNWGFFLVTLACVWKCITSTVAFVKFQPGSTTDEDNIAWYLKIQWVLYNVTFSGALVISLVYWTALYKGAEAPDFLNIATHGLNSVYVLSDIWITATPTRIHHFYQAPFLGIVYTLFSVIYWAAGGKGAYGKDYIYPILDWGVNPGQAAGLSIGLSFAAVPVLHCVMYALYTLRLFLYTKCPTCRRETIYPTV